MKLSTLLLALALSPSCSTATQVLRGSQQSSSTPFRLLPVDKKKLSGGDTKLKLPSADNNNNGIKLSAGSAADALAGLKNVKKCKKKRVTSNNNAPPANANTANIFEVADPALTTTATTATTTSRTTSATGAFETYQSSLNKTTTIPTTTGTTTVITTLATSKATEGIISVQQETRAVNNNDVTSFEISDSTDWIMDICDENGNVIPPNTYFPTSSPGNDDFFLMSSNNEEQQQGNAPSPTAVVTTKAPSSSGFAFTPSDDGIVDDDDSTTLYSPGCESFANNQVFETSIVASVDFVYEILVSSSSSSDDVDLILEQLEGNLVNLLGGEMIHCESIRRSLLRSTTRVDASTNTIHKNNNRRLESQVDGISSSPVDTVSSSSCTYFTSSESTVCHSIQGGITLYLRENSSSSSASESSTRALKILMTTFNDNDSASAFINDVDGLMGIRYISGTPDQDVGVDTNNELPKNVVGGAAEESKNVSSQEKKELSSVGISLLAIGSVFIVSMILVGIKKSIGDNRAFETYDEFYDDDQDLNKEWKNENGENNNGDDTSLNDTMGSISSNDSQKTGRLAMIYNEEESVNNTTCSIIRELQASEAYAASHGIHDNDGSSTRRPVFVSTRDDEIVEIYGVNTSIYTQSSELTKPTFENPARLGNERNYSVDDTVEF